jgi:NAD(P)-dependent dehydrogenase (short-subunit alcohol dehydrogenase family)
LKVAFVAGVADAKGFGWATAKQLANAGATVIVGKFEEVLASFGQDQLRIRDFLSPSSRYQVARYFQGANLFPFNTAKQFRTDSSWVLQGIPEM